MQVQDFAAHEFADPYHMSDLWADATPVTGALGAGMGLLTASRPPKAQRPTYELSCPQGRRHAHLKNTSHTGAHH